MHKFVGGVQTPGVLIAKKSLFRNRVPNGGGGGAVFFVSETDHRWLQVTNINYLSVLYIFLLLGARDERGGWDSGYC